MEVICFDEIREALISNMKQNMLIPIIGSGFTRGCSSFKGTVPSGEDYQKYMINEIVSGLKLSNEKREKLKQESFSRISSIYHSPKVVSLAKRKDYLRNNFTRVEIEEYKKDFLSLSWPYIYTLNIDDGIENGSRYHHVVYANRQVNAHIFDEESCVVKLHGDVNEMLTYEDSVSEIFSQKQYIDSLRNNDSLLTKLTHDSIYQNLLFVGCSLDDEIDLLDRVSIPSEDKAITAKYYCAVGEPDILAQINLENYGITHCVLFESYEQMYTVLFEAGIEAQEICVDDLDNYKHIEFTQLSADFNENKSHLLFGKSLIGKDHRLSIPHFFISREIAGQIIANIGTYPLQILLGSGCSGRSYILADIVYRIRDREVLLFETKDRLTKAAFHTLFHRTNQIILVDNNSLSVDQIEFLLTQISTLQANSVSIIMVANRNDRYLDGILHLYEQQEVLTSDLFTIVEIDSVLSKPEIANINPRLTAIDAGVFSPTKSIVDNILDLSNKLSEKNRYQKIRPDFNSIPNIAALIALATERKVYSTRAVELNIHNELYLQCKLTTPLIDSESTWSFERAFGDNAPQKYVVNAEYWLCRQLESFAHTKNNHEKIAKAYQYLISRIIAHDGAPKLLYGNRRAAYRDYILFDNINRIFCSRKSYGEDGLALIRIIYEELNTLLSVDPHYMHQRAKCYIKSSYYATQTSQKAEYLDIAYRDVNVALQVFSQRYENTHNEKIAISIAHTIYTQALILCHQCNINNYQDIKATTTAIQVLYEAMCSPYNSYDFAKRDSFNYQNVIEKIVKTVIASPSLVDKYVYPMLEYLFKIIMSAT